MVSCSPTCSLNTELACPPLPHTRSRRSTPITSQRINHPVTNRSPLPPSQSLLIQRAAAIRWRHMRLQKISDAPVGVDLIFDLGKAVTFVLIDFVFDHAAALLDRVTHLLRFGFWATRVITARQPI